MSKKSRLAVFVLLISGGAVAQAPDTSYSDPFAPSHLMMEMLHRELRRPDNRKRIAAEKRRLEFTGRVQKFTDLWNKLMENGAKGTWDPKQARDARKAFESVIESDGWLEAK